MVFGRFLLLATAIFWLAVGSISMAQPSNPKVAALIQKAQAQLGQGKFAAAEKTIRDGLKQLGDLPGPNYLLGYACHAQKKYQQALAAYEKAKKAPNVKTNALYNMACVYSMQGSQNRVEPLHYGAAKHASGIIL